MASTIGVLPTSLVAAFPVAFVAGLVSFVSPCVLPLLPGYLAFLGGATGSAARRGGRGRAVAGSVAFVVGFALVFVSFGALFGSLGRTLSLHQRGLEECFGVVTIVLGLFFAGWWPSKWLSRERRSHRLPRTTVLGAGLLGILFALGWTPCIGPTLGAILGLASSTSGASAARGSMLAFVYCLGLGLPFIVAALASEWFMTASGWLRRHAGVIGVLGGIMLISIGVAEITGWWASWILWLKTQSWAQSSSSWL